MVARWLLLEQAGPWPPTALESLRLPGGLGAELVRRAAQHNVRIVLIRRYGRAVSRSDSGPGPACYAAHVRPTGSWLGRVRLDAPADILDLDFAAVTAGPSPAAETVDGPLFCICTHGRHDPCCAERGRPVAAAIAARFPEQTWEVSHIGGDRFAANLVCLPDGDYLGRLGGADAVDVAARYVDGRYSLPHLRGRSCYRPVVQAAEVLVRRELGVERRGAVSVLGWKRDGEHTLVAMSVAGHGDVTAHILTRPAAPTRQLTCYAQSVLAPVTYELVDPVSGSATG
jgi:hypothetical protein